MRERAEQLGVVALDALGVEALRLSELRVDVAVRVLPRLAYVRRRRCQTGPYTTSPRSLPSRGVFMRYSASSRVSRVS